MIKDVNERQTSKCHQMISTSTYTRFTKMKSTKTTSNLTIFSHYHILEPLLQIASRFYNIFGSCKKLVIYKQTFCLECSLQKDFVYLSLEEVQNHYNDSKDHSES